MKIFKFLSIYFLATSVLIGCIKTEFDDPPNEGQDPDLVPTMTIAELKAMHVAGTNPNVLTEENVIKGVCNSSDRSGNIFKQISIEDSTGGILIRMDRNDLYSDFVPGRNVFVKLKDLALGDFNGTYQLGILSEDGRETDRLTDDQIDEHVFAGKFFQALEKPEKTIPELDFNRDQNTLVILNEVEFVDFTTTYATLGGGRTQNRTLKDCNGNEIVMRNSDFATFAGEFVPTGRLQITGLFTAFGSTKQFTIRDLSDVTQIEESRCDGSIVTGGGEDPNLDVTMTIAELKAMHTVGNAPTVISGEEVINGIAISSDETGNFFKQLVIQDATGGIEIRMDRNDLYTKYPIGTNVFVKLKDLAVGDFNGNYQIGIADGPDTDRIPDGVITTTVLAGKRDQDIPQNIKTIDALDPMTDQNTLVTLQNVEFGSSFLSQTYADAEAQFSRNIDVLDCENNKAVLRSSGFADFAGTTVAQGNGTLTAVFTIFGTTKQLLIRDLGDVRLNGDRCEGGGSTGDELFFEDFNEAVDNTDLNLEGWTNFKESGSVAWKEEVFNDDGYAEAKVFDTGESDMKAWLITPAIDLKTDNILNFKTAQAFHDSDNLEVFISNDFNGTDVLGATWSPISARLADGDDPRNDFFGSGDVSLSTYNNQTIHVAFYYEGSDGGDKTTTYRVDDVVVK